MGNQQSLPSNIETLRIESWVQAGEDQQNALFSNVNPYRRRLLANIITHELIQQYELNFITEQDYNSYIAELNYRQKRLQESQQQLQQNYIYPIRYFVNKSKQEMCTTIHTGYLYADKVDLRLKEINDIPFQDLLYMYRATLNGFKALYEKVGYFDIVQEMIFITRRGEVKIWMNANLAKNYPNYEKAVSSQNVYSKKDVESLYGSQAEMIRKLISMIEKNSDQYADTQPQNQLFSQFLESKNIYDKLSFQHSLQEYYLYLSQNNLHCPQYMKSIPELFSPDELFQSHNQKNYDQSHVNEITTQHLTQMKKKFQPMETIVEDEKYLGSSTNVATINNVHRVNAKFHESQVAMYAPPSIANFGGFRGDIVEGGSSKVVRPGQSPFTDMGQSRYSHQGTRHHQHEHDHLRQSSNSNNVIPQQKLNSVSNLNYRNTPIINVTNHPQLYHQPQNQLNYQNVFAKGSFNSGGYAHQQYLPQNKVYMVPPTSFTAMQGVNNGNGMYYQKLPAVSQNNYSFPSYPPKTIVNPQINKTNSPQRNLTLHQNTIAFNHQPIQSPNDNPIKIPQPIKKTLPEQRSQKTQSNNEKSKIKYFTTKDSYQLDDQIANDLQKFLGLKVN